MKDKRCLERQQKVMCTLQALARLGTRWSRRVEGLFDEMVLPGVVEPSSFRSFLRGLGVVLDHRFEALREAQDDREAWESRLVRLRGLRDEAMEQVYERMIRVRRMTDLAFGVVTTRELFGVGETPRVASELAEQTRRLLTRLDHPNYRALLERRQKDPWPGWWEMVDGMREPLVRLELVLAELVDAEAAKTRSVETRNQAMRRLDDCQKGVTSLLEGLCHLTGELEAVRELRP